LPERLRRPRLNAVPVPERKRIMPIITILIGAALAGYGAYSYAIAVEKSPTALIPSYIGAAFIVLGVLALKAGVRKHAMHVAAVVGLIGFLGGAWKGLPALPALLVGDLAGKELNKAMSQNLLAFVCLGFVLLCIGSFVRARARRRQAAAAPSTQVPK
jgi:hypothetical protein